MLTGANDSAGPYAAAPGAIGPGKSAAQFCSEEQHMNLETIYYVAQSIAVVVIIATLLALLAQVRLSVRMARLDMADRFVGAQNRWMLDVAKDRNLAALFRKVFFDQAKDIDPVEVTQVLFIFNQTLNNQLMSNRAATEGLIHSGLIEAGERNLC